MQKLSREESGLAETSRERSGNVLEKHSNGETPFDNLLRNVRAAERELQQTESALRQTAQVKDRASETTTTRTVGAAGRDEIAPFSGISEAEKQAKIARIRLKNAYEILILTDFMFSAQHGIEDKLWRNVFYARIEELRSALRKSPSPANALRLRSELCEHIDMGSGFYHALLDHFRKKSVKSAGDRKEDAPNFPQPDDDKEEDSLAQIENSGFGQRGAEEAIEYLKSQARTPDNTHSVVANTLQRCLIALGDLARYQEILMQSTASDSNAVEIKLEAARRYYEKGRRVCPDNGKAHAQLAIIENVRGRDLDMVYWYMLSLAAKNPSNVSRDNLRSFYTKYDRRPPQSAQQSGGKHCRKVSDETTSKKGATEDIEVEDDVEETEESEEANAAIALDKFVFTSLMLHRQVFFDQFQGQESNSSLAHTALRHLRVLASSMSSDAVDEFTLAVAVAVNKVLVICTLTMWYLQMRLKKAEDMASARQSIRASQSCAAGFAFDICRVISNTIIGAFPMSPSPISPSLSSLRTTSRTTLEPLVPIAWAASLLSPVAIWSDFCAGNSDLLGQLYCSVAEGGAKSPQESPEETLQQKYQFFFKAIHVICTSLPHATNHEAERIALPEDLELMGSIPFCKLQFETRSIRAGSSFSRGYVANDDERILLEGRLRRVLSAGLKFAKMETFPFLNLGENEGTFIVIDEEAKKRERERQMRAMAQQLLKQQVDALEHNLDRLAMSSGTSSSKSALSLSSKTSRNIRNIVLDMSILLDGLGVVRRVISSGAFRAIVPLSVIDRLDVLKKGNDSVNQRARDAIRYLDKTLGVGDADPLRAQRATEKLSSWSMAQKYAVHRQQESGSVGDQNKSSSVTHVDESLITSEVATRSATDVPKPMRAALSCCLWHLQKIENTGTDQTNVPSMTSLPLVQSRNSASEPAIILATTDPALVGFARWFGILVWTRKELANALTELT